MADGESCVSRRTLNMPLSERRKLHIRRERRLASRFARKFRRELARRYGNQCANCGATDDLRLDHIRPVSLGGATRIDNLQLLCPLCDMEKGTQIINYRLRKR